MDMSLRAEAMPDNPYLQAFLVGPIVLAGQFPGHDLAPDLRSNQQGPAINRAPKIKVPSIAAAGRAATECLRPTGPLNFVLDTGTSEIAMKPLSQSWDRFVVYWTIA